MKTNKEVKERLAGMLISAKINKNELMIVKIEKGIKTFEKRIKIG